MRDGQFDGIISFRQGLAVGWLITIVYASLVGMLVYLFGLFVSQDFLHNSIVQTVAGFEMLRNEIDADHVEAIAWIEESIAKAKATTLADLALGDFASKMAAGLFISLIIAAVLRQRAPKAPKQPEISE